jgi:hypothetical protein
VVAEGDGLRRLQVGEARHHGAREGEGLFGEGELQVGELGVEAVDRVAHP